MKITTKFVETLKAKDFYKFLEYKDTEKFKTDISFDKHLKSIINVKISVSSETPIRSCAFSDFTFADMDCNDNIFKQDEEITQKLKDIQEKYKHQTFNKFFNLPELYINNMEWQMFMLDNFGDQYEECLIQHYSQYEASWIVKELKKCVKQFKINRIASIEGQTKLQDFPETIKKSFLSLLTIEDIKGFYQKINSDAFLIKNQRPIEKFLGKELFIVTITDETLNNSKFQDVCSDTEYSQESPILYTKNFLTPEFTAECKKEKIDDDLYEGSNKTSINWQIYLLSLFKQKDKSNNTNVKNQYEEKLKDYYKQNGNTQLFNAIQNQVKRLENPTTFIQSTK